jgi:hypothetical protein
MKKNSKVTVDVGMIASIVATAVAQAMEAYTAPITPVAPVKGKKSAAQFSAALGVNVTKKWVTLKPVMVKDITPEEHKLRCAAYKEALALGVGYVQATYAGYHAVKNSR